MSGEGLRCVAVSVSMPGADVPPERPEGDPEAAPETAAAVDLPFINIIHSFIHFIPFILDVC